MMTTLQIVFCVLSLTACSLGLPYTKTEHLIRPRDVSHSKVKRQTLGTSFSNFVSPDFSIQVGCAAALICVEEEFCTMSGMISTNRIQLDDRQILQRVPLSSCRNPDNGIIGKCCRDPNYVDPWPAGNLPANYSGGFDEQGFPTFLNIAKLRPTKKPSTRLPTPTLPPPSIDITPSPGNNIQYVQTTTNFPTTQEAPIIPDGSGTPEAIIPISSTQEPPIDSNPSDYFPEIRIPVQPPSSAPLPQYPLGPCGVRNDVPRPINLNDPQAAFAEIPWQAMILSNSQKKILCSGVLVSANVVVTAARCVDRIPVNDVAVKLGEWKLGYELKHEEPLPFEIVNVSQIEIHPNYSPDQSSGDMAVLFLEHPVKFDAHVNPICLPDVAQVPTDCIVTGWGKVILEENLAGAVMNKVDVEYLPPHSCEDHLAHTTADISMHQGAICARVQKQRNNMCQVDVGGPMTCTDSNGLYNLVGVYSQDTGCLPTNQVATFAPVDMAWLNDTMHGIRPPKISLPNEFPLSGKELMGDSTIQQETLQFQKSNLPPDANQYLPPQ